MENVQASKLNSFAFAVILLMSMVIGLMAIVALILGQPVIAAAVAGAALGLGMIAKRKKYGFGVMWISLVAAFIAVVVLHLY